MSSTNGSTTLKATVLSIGAVAALGVVFIIHNRRTLKRKQQSKDDANKKDETISSRPIDSVATFYNQLGISEENLPDHIRREIYKQRQRKAKEAMISMKTPMYDNIHMLDEDREAICTISMKKAKWYIRKNIAEWSSPKEGSELSKNVDVKCIRLLFTHNGANEDEEKKSSSTEKLYLRSAKQNICVSCGSDGRHIRHYIVPYSYRSLLPDDYKSHMSHDIVILCPDCHVRCERSTKKRMKRMENELRMKMADGDAFCSPVIEDAHLYHVRSCAIALVKWKNTMPTEKIDSYENEVRCYLADCCKNDAEKETILTGNEPLTKAQLQKVCSVKYRVKNPRYVPGSEVVVRSLKNDREKIEEFIVDWRKHFIAIVDPQHMPTGWRVDNPVAKGSSFVLLV